MSQPRVPRVEKIATAAQSQGEPIELYRLRAGSLVLELITLGAAITRLDVPDGSSRLVNVVLNHAQLADYGRGREYFGAIVGRVANRLRGALLPLDGTVHALSVNEGPHHLHGGVKGFDRHHWRVAETVATGDRASVTLERTSPSGEEGYPGELLARVRYTLTTDGSVAIHLTAETDRATAVNLTNHSYFNLRGSGDVLQHELQIEADRFCVIDADFIPTGELRDVRGTPFDFRRSKPIGRDLRMPDEQLRIAGGYDHCMDLRASQTASSGSGRAANLDRACVLFEPVSGRRLEVWTDQPGVQLYSGNFLDGRVRDASGRPIPRHGGLCLETQRFPDAPNHPAFPCVVLRPGETYSAATLWRFTN